MSWTKRSRSTGMQPEHAEAAANTITPNSDSVHVPFRVIVLALSIGLLIELAALLLIPKYTVRVLNRTSRAGTIAAEPLRPFRNDLLSLLPPTTGRRYSVQQPTDIDHQAKTLHDHLLGRSEDEKLRLLQGVQDPDRVLSRVMDLCFDGTAEEARVEEFLIRNVDSGKITASADGIFDSLRTNYLFPAQRSEFAGFPDDAKRLYRRFLILGRSLSTDTALSEDVLVQRQLSRAQVRLKVLGAAPVLTPKSLQTVQTKPVEEVVPLIDGPDPLIRAFARYEAASLLWHGDRAEPARKLLDGHLAECGPLNDECEFLLAKILEPSDSGNALKALCARLPNDHYLLDDVYWRRIAAARDRHDTASGLKLLSEVRQRCPNTDRAYSFAAFESELRGKKESSGHGDR